MLQHLIKPEYYLQFLHDLHEAALVRLKEKLGRGEKIRIATVAVSIQEYIGDEICRLFMADSRFEFMAITCKQTNCEAEELYKLQEHLDKVGIPSRFADGTILPSDFDILLYQSPYWFQLENFGNDLVPPETLVCYAAYGFCTSNAHNLIWNTEFHKSCWKNFIYNKADFAVGKVHSDIGDYGYTYTGYPKLDPLLEPEKIAPLGRFKIAGGRDYTKVQKIIYAPHHSINEIPWQSTFPQNYEFMLDYAKKHPEKSFIFKPHGLLKASTVKNGIFRSEAEFDAYAAEWDRLPNGKYVQFEYLPYFVNSDCMVMDCISFITEYFYVNKPLLYLTREKLNLNEYGQLAIKQHYTMPGDNHKGIADWLENEALTDPHKGKRTALFEALLDYYGETGRTAAQNMYHAIADEFNDVKKKLQL